MLALTTTTYPTETQSQENDIGMFSVHDTPFCTEFTQETLERVLLPSGSCDQIAQAVKEAYHRDEETAFRNHLGLSEEGIFHMENDESVGELGYGLGEMEVVAENDESDDEEEGEMGIFVGPEDGIVIPFERQDDSQSSIDWDGYRPDSYS